jgi:hypothetical protein
MYLFIYVLKYIYLSIYISIYLYVCMCPTVCAFFIWVCLKMTYLPKISWWIIHFPVKQRDLRGVFDPIQTGPVGTSRGTVRAWANSTADLGSWEVRWSPTDKARTGFRPGRSHHAGNVLDVRYGGVLNGGTPIAGWFMMVNPKHVQQIGLGRRHRKPWFSPFKCVFSCKCSLQFRERFHFWMIHPITVIHVNYLIFFPIS